MQAGDELNPGEPVIIAIEGTKGRRYLLSEVQLVSLAPDGTMASAYFLSELFGCFFSREPWGRPGVLAYFSRPQRMVRFRCATKQQAQSMVRELTRLAGLEPGNTSARIE